MIAAIGHNDLHDQRNPADAVCSLRCRVKRINISLDALSANSMPDNPWWEY